jgi:hypothetical protein
MPPEEACGKGVGWRAGLGDRGHRRNTVTASENIPKRLLSNGLSLSSHSRRPGFSRRSITMVSVTFVGQASDPPSLPLRWKWLFLTRGTGSPHRSMRPERHCLAYPTAFNALTLSRNPAAFSNSNFRAASRILSSNSPMKRIRCSGVSASTSSSASSGTVT